MLIIIRQLKFEFKGVYKISCTCLFRFKCIFPRNFHDYEKFSAMTRSHETSRVMDDVMMDALGVKVTPTTHLLTFQLQAVNILKTFSGLWKITHFWRSHETSRVMDHVMIDALSKCQTTQLPLGSNNVCIYGSLPSADISTSDFWYLPVATLPPHCDWVSVKAKMIRNI